MVRKSATEKKNEIEIKGLSLNDIGHLQLGCPTEIKQNSGEIIHVPKITKYYMSASMIRLETEKDTYVLRPKEEDEETEMLEFLSEMANEILA